MKNISKKLLIGGCSIMLLASAGCSGKHNLCDGKVDESALQERDEQIASLQEQIEALNAQIKTLGDDLNTKDEVIEDLEQQIADLTKELEILRATWNGSNKTTEWYEEDKTTLELKTGNDLAGFANLVEEGNTFKGKTVQLAEDIYLGGNQWTPIEKFEGTFDGNGHIINDLTIYSCAGEGSKDFSYNGMFRSLTDAEVKNVTIDGVTITPYKEYEETYDDNGYPNYMGEKGLIAGQTHGDVTISNITIKNSFITTYNNSVGGIVAEVRDGTTTFSNIDIDSSNTFQAFWGTYDGPVGGLAGLVKSGAKVVIENVNMAAKIDVYNDACANYQYFQYRYAGMLLSCVEGMNETNYTDIITASNVTVTFDSWNQYRYCEYAANGKPSGAAEGDYKYSRINEPDGSWNDHGAPETHTHGEDESCNVLLPFFNIYGFDGVGGIKPKLANLTPTEDHYEDTTSVAGVKIIYLNGSETGLED